jgi:hypothetical protein
VTKTERWTTVAWRRGRRFDVDAVDDVDNADGDNCDDGMFD